MQTKLNAIKICKQKTNFILRFRQIRNNQTANFKISITTAQFFLNREGKRNSEQKNSLKFPIRKNIQTERKNKSIFFSKNLFIFSKPNL